MPTFSVRLTGLEPAHREILDPKSSASTNSATGANRRVNFGLTMSIPFRVPDFCGCKGTKKSEK